MSYLIPKPVKKENHDGRFFLKPNTEIILDNNNKFKSLNNAKILQKEIENKVGFKLLINKYNIKKEETNICLRKSKEKKQSYMLEITKKKIEIIGADEIGLFYGIQTLRQIIRKHGASLPCLRIEDYPFFKHRGFYHDITRGKVPTLDTLKDLVDKISFYKLNQLQLYIEHTFAFKKYSEIWLGSDPLTSEEILLLDEYCKNRNVELVPSLATFGHLYHALRTDKLSYLAEMEDAGENKFSWLDRMRHHTLDVSNPDSFEFVRNMLKQFIPLFSSDKFNVCGDETFDLGKGKTKNLVKKIGKGKLYISFLKKIINEVKKYDKKVMFWGDIILKYPELLDELPEDIICLNWNYNKNPNEKDFEDIYKSNIPQLVCPGVSGWNKLMNDMDSAFYNITRVVSYGKKYNALGVLNTDWGDYGHINLLSNSIPGMIYGAALSWNPDTIENLTNNLNKEDFLMEKFNEIDEIISRLEFNDNSGEIVKLLRDLSRNQIINWGHIVQWKEIKYKETSVDINIGKLFKELSGKELKKSYYESLQISHKIINKMNQVNDINRLEYREFYISAQGVALLNALAIYIKKYDFDQDIISIDISMMDLADNIEIWFKNYKNIWRLRNKESELGRIESTFSVICSFLRKMSNQ